MPRAADFSGPTESWERPPRSAYIYLALIAVYVVEIAFVLYRETGWCGVCLAPFIAGCFPRRWGSERERFAFFCFMLLVWTALAIRAIIKLS